MIYSKYIGDSICNIIDITNLNEHEKITLLRLFKVINYIPKIKYKIN